METIRQALATAAVFLALGAVLWLLRRTGRAGRLGFRRRSASRLEAVERVPLSPNHALHLVRFGNRALLIAAHAGGCTLLESSTWNSGEPSAALSEEPLR